MGSGRQLRLLLWKDYLVRKRNPGVLGLAFGWAFAVFMVLYIVRISLHSYDIPTCQFKARALPSAGLLPFVQSFICNIDNKCESIDQYEHVPQYKNAKLGALSTSLEKLLGNESIVNLIYNFPNIVKVFTSVAKTVKDGTDIGNLFKTGIPISDLFTDAETVKRRIVRENVFSEGTASAIFNASLNYGYVLQIFTSTNYEEIICEPKNLRKFLLLNDPSTIEQVSDELCHLDGAVVPSLVQNVITRLNFGKLFDELGNVMDSLSSYDFFLDLQTFARKILQSESLKTAIPFEIKLDEWVPEIIPLFRNVSSGSQPDFTFVHKALNKIEPTFVGNEKWLPAKKIIANSADMMIWFQKRAQLINKEFKTEKVKFSDNVTVFAKQIEDKVKRISSEEGVKNFTLLQKKIAGFFRDGANWEPFYYAANILDGIVQFLPKNYSAVIEKIPFAYGNAMLIVNHGNRIHEQAEQLLYDYLSENFTTVDKILTNLDEKVLKTMLKCLHKTECAMELIENSQVPEQFYCDLNKLEKFFTVEHAGQVKQLSCNNMEWIGFVEYVTKAYSFEETINQAFSNESNNNKYEANFYSAVHLTKLMFDKIFNSNNGTKIDGTSTAKNDWSKIVNSNNNKKNVLEIAGKFRYVYLLNAQLAMFKKRFENDLDAFPFRQLSVVLDGSVEEISTLPLPLAVNFRSNYQQLIEVLLLTVGDSQKISKLTASADWRKHYCATDDIDLINYPKNADKYRIKNVLCDLDMFYELKLSRSDTYNPLAQSIRKALRLNSTQKEDFSGFVKSFGKFSASLSNMFAASSKSINYETYDWTLSKNLFSKLASDWFDLIDFETGFQISAHLLIRTVQLYDYAVFGATDEQDWTKIKNMSQKADRIITAINELNELKLLTSVKDEFILKYSKEVPELIAAIKNVSSTQNKNVTNWLNVICSSKTSGSVGSVEVFLNETVCNSNEDDDFDSFYVDDFNEAKTTSWHKKLVKELRRSSENIPESVYEKYANHKEDIKELQRHLLNAIKAERTRPEKITLSDMWRNYENCSLKRSEQECDQMRYDLSRFNIRYIMKSVAVLAERSVRYLSIVNGSTVSYLSVMGFHNESGPVVIYEKFGDLIVALVHTYQRPNLEQKILELISESKAPKCEDLTNLIVTPPGSAITAKDLDTVKKYLCPRIWDLPVMKDNVFLETVSALQSLFLDDNVHDWTETYDEVLDNVLQMKEHVKYFGKKQGLNIEPMFNDDWLGRIKNSMKILLEYKYKLNNSVTRLFKYVPLNTSTDSLLDGYKFIGSYQYVLDYMSTNLDKYSNDNDLISTNNTDLQTVVDIYDFYPKDVLGIFFYSYYIQLDSNVGVAVSFKDICRFKFENATIDFTVPKWILKDSHKTLEKLCKNVDLKKIQSEIFPSPEESSLLLPINLEGILIDFAKVLLNMVDEDRMDATFSIVEALDKFHAMFTKKSMSETEIKEATQKMLNFYVDTYSVKKIQRIDTQIYLRTLALKVFRGGDWWPALVDHLKDYPTVRKIFMIAQQVPTLPVNVMEAATAPNLLYNFTARYVYNGTKSLCDVNLQNLGDETNILVLIQNVACAWNKRTIVKELLRNRLAVSQDDSATGRYNKTILERHLYEMNAAFNDFVSKGLEPFQRPDWTVKENIENAYKLYVTKNKQPIIMLQTVTSSMTQLFDIGYLFYKNESNCNWCNGATIFVQQIKKHLSYAQKYVDFTCRAQHMNLTQIYETLKKDFQIDDFTSQITSGMNYTVEDFNDELHEIVDAFRLQAIIFSTNSTARELAGQCPKDIAKQLSKGNVFNVDAVVQIGVQLAKIMQSSSARFADIPEIRKAFEKVEKFVEPVMRLYKPTTDLLTDKKFANVPITVVKQLLESKLDVNYLLRTNYAADFAAVNETQFDRIFESASGSENLYAAFAANQNLTEQLLSKINRTLIEEKIDEWRRDAARNFEWFAQIFEEVEEIFRNGGGLLQVASKINLQDISASAFGTPEILDGIIGLVQDHKIDKLFDGLRTLIYDLGPLINNATISRDLHLGLDALESMELFANLLLLRIKVNVSDLFADWPERRNYFVQTSKIKAQVVDEVLGSQLDLMSVLASQKKLLELRSVVCNPQSISKLFQTERTANAVLSEALCDLNVNSLRKAFGILFGSVQFENLMEKLRDSGVKNLLRVSNLSASEGDVVLGSLSDGVRLLPEVRSTFGEISAGFTGLPIAGDSSEGLFTGGFLGQASKLLCGRSIIPESNKFYRVVAEASDSVQAENYDEELAGMRTPFCKNLYKEVLTIPGGKLIWTYMKPYMKGQILFTPDTPRVRNIIGKANATFAEMGKFYRILDSLSNGLNEITTTKNMNQLMRSLEKFLESPVIRIILQRVTGSSSGFSLKNLNLTEITESLGQSKDLQRIASLGVGAMQCVLIDRFRPFATEESLEIEANNLIQKNEFMAGVVFMDADSNRAKRSADDFNVTYKIRMDLDNVPSTSRLKSLFWEPGPEGDFLDNLRYFRGFVQLQDMLDTAIIKTTSEDVPKWSTYTQQMPYPCWKNDFFQTAINIAQSLQACFFFGLMVFIAASVRFLVWEKETTNVTLMHVMGMKYWTHTLSWSFVSIVEGFVAVFIIFVVLKLGGIVPVTNPQLLIILMLLFAVSIVSFCYMISNLFNSASLAAVASVILYLLSYMPYIIIIALETNLNFLEKMLTSLSMSSAFCYGGLYLMRYEVQGNGLDWHNVWQSPIPDDGMNFGFAVVMLVFDTVLYAIIGFAASVYLRSEVKSNLDAEGVQVASEESLKVGVNIAGLTKVYKNSKQEVKAVDDINIQMYAGQVTTLLGHNGAGKTTLIKILTGMMTPTRGQITINNAIKEKCKPGHQYIGVCPQVSVLIESLTAKEHLLFYAQLKTQQNANAVLPDVLDMLDTMSFGTLSNEPVAHLSEGMRRRLCIGIAFIGNPSLVVLDEPSSGVDPIARRQLWELISQHKEGRTVLLTTHHLDEAEVLSDRIVILHKGKVLCSGTPLSLKHDYGNGYDVTVSYNQLGKISNEKDALMEAVKSVTPNATVTSVSNTEIKINVPFAEGADNKQNNFEELATLLEKSKSQLDFTHFAMNCTTLEQTFLKLCKSADESAARNQTNLTDFSELIINTHIDDIILDNGNGEKVVETFADDDNLTGTTFDKFTALMKKRALHYFQDWRILVCAFVLPTVFTAIAMGFSLIRPPSVDDPVMKMTPDLYFPHSTQFLSDYNAINASNQFVHAVKENLLHESYDKKYTRYEKTNRNCKCAGGNHYCPDPSKTYYNTLVRFDSVNETIDWLLDTQDEYIEKRYGGWSLEGDSVANKSSMVVWYNNKGYHSMPGYLNSLSNAILKGTAHRNASITTYNHPLKLSGDQLTRRSVAQHIADVGIASVILIAFSLVPASGAIYLVQERTSQEKRVQILCGVSPTLYWTVALLWDILMLFGALVLAVCVFEIFGLPIYVERWNLPAICLLLGLYGWACTPMVHLVQRYFQDASMANMTLFCTGVFLGMSQLTSILLMDILGTTKFVEDFRNVLHDFFLIFPQFCLADGLIEISKNNIKSSLLSRFNIDTYQNPLGWELMGLHYTFLALMGLVFFVVNIVIENRWYERPKKYDAVRKLHEDSLEMVGLHKEFKSVSGKKVAVNSLSLQVPNGECLGLIGVNGAGKSTTFKMLTGEISPTHGTIRIQGQDVREGILYSGIVGYCPQKDSLDPKLTVFETLEIYGKLRGIGSLKLAIKDVLLRFGLSPYENRKVEALSGGNKRKLCAAISVLGNTSLILMDEPTSGMDPKSRAIVAKEVKRLVKENKSVVLTSHSMEECENLCTKVAILVNGRLVCEGTPSELKNRLGSGYILNVRLASQEQQSAFHDSVLQEFAGCKLQSCNYCSSQFLIPTRSVALSQIFRGINTLKQRYPVKDYTLFQSSLDQVFITLASSEQDNKGFVDDAGANECYSMGPIHIENHNAA